MSLLLWSVVASLSGLAVYLVAAVVVAPVLPDRARRAAAHWYWRQAGAVGGRIQIVKRDHGTHTLIATDYRAEWGDEGTLDDEKGHWRDEGNNMGRLFGRPIGLVSERFDVIMHPRHAEIGQEHIRLEERGDDVIRVATDGGEMTAHETRVELPGAPRLVDAHAVDGILGDSAAPRLGEISYEFAKKSQAGFTSRNLVEVMAFIMAYAASFGMIWFLASQGDTVTRSIPI